MAHSVKELAKRMPEYCASRLPSTGEAVIIRFGVSGYFPAGHITDVDAYNKSRGVTEAQVQAMECGSMFGWDVPGANPDRY